MSIGYSEAERAVLALLRKRKRVTVQEMVDLYYDKKNPPPFHAEPTMRSVLVRLQRKAEFNNEPFRITTEKRAGQNLVYVFGLKTRIRA